MINLISFKDLSDNRGGLVSYEESRNIPFPIKRIYCIYDVRRDVSRGYHSHKELEQVAVCIQGSCTMLLDNGEQKESVVLSSPYVGLYIGKNIWRVMKNFSEDCVLLVLASKLYDESDYIRTYDKFLNELEVSQNEER